jgi:cell division septum initiation protein DivIVA
MEKVREVKKIRRSMRQVEDENESLRSAIAELEAKLKASASVKAVISPSSAVRPCAGTRHDFDFEAEDLELSTYVAGQYSIS